MFLCSNLECRLQHRSVCKVLFKNIACEQTVIYFQPLKHDGSKWPPEVSWCLPICHGHCVFDHVCADRTANDYKKKKKKIMQISHHARQQFLSAGAELSEMPFELNSLHL